MHANTSRHLLKTIAVATVIAGTLDILDAFAFYGVRGVAPSRILQSIASALLGRSAYAGGFEAAAFGLVIHFAITLFWANLFVLLATRLAALSRYAIAAGLLYGLVVYFGMNYVALPLTRLAPVRHPSGTALANAVAALVFLIGLPIALVNRWLSPASQLSS